MSQFAYRAVNANGGIVRGRLDAINIVDLEMRLRHLQLDLIEGTVANPLGNFSARVSRSELINFCFHLEQLTRSGVPIIEAIVDLRDSVTDKTFREILAGVVESIEGGKSFSQALADHPRTFDEVMVSLIHSGETSGRLPEVLLNLTNSLKWQDELIAHTKKLAMYPAFMLFVMVGLVFFMMTYLVPKLVMFLKNTGQKLPLQTELLIFFSNFFVHYWYLLLLLPAALIAAFFVLRNNPTVRFQLDAFKLWLPIVGDIQRKIILSRFAQTFAMMYVSGIGVLDCVQATEKVVGNEVIAKGLQRAGQFIAEGSTVSMGFQKVGLFPPLVIRMLRVGESTGGLGDALTNVSYFYNRDVRESIERMQGLVGPFMTVIIGAILLWIMIAVLGPIYDTITKLKT